MVVKYTCKDKGFALNIRNISKWKNRKKIFQVNKQELFNALTVLSWCLKEAIQTRKNFR